MSPTGFRWFVCAVVAVLVAIMLVVVRSNTGWPSFAPGATAGTHRDASHRLATERQWTAARPDRPRPVAAD